MNEHIALTLKNVDNICGFLDKRGWPLHVYSPCKLLIQQKFPNYLHIRQVKKLVPTLFLSHFYVCLLTYMCAWRHAHAWANTETHTDSRTHSMRILMYLHSLLIHVLWSETQTQTHKRKQACTGACMHTCAHIQTHSHTHTHTHTQILWVLCYFTSSYAAYQIQCSRKFLGAVLSNTWRVQVNAKRFTARQAFPLQASCPKVQSRTVSLRINHSLLWLLFAFV